MMQVKYKAADTSRSSDTVATADPDLQFAMSSGGVYLIRGQATFRGYTAGGLKIGFYAGGGTITRGSGLITCPNEAYPDDADVPVANENTSGAVSSDMIVTGSTRAMGLYDGAYWWSGKFVFMLQANSAGTFSVIWAQNTSTANATTCLAGSILTYEQLA